MRPAINVCIALSTLLDLDEEPGDLAGIGPISATAARDLAADPSGTWRRITTDQHGRLIDYGTTPTDHHQHNHPDPHPLIRRGGRPCVHRVRHSAASTTGAAMLRAQ